MVAKYRQRLTTQRGLALRTVAPHIEPFLQRLFGAGPVNVRRLQPANVETEVKHCLRLHSRGFARIASTALCSFLRYLLFSGLVDIDLTAAVPKVA